MKKTALAALLVAGLSVPAVAAGYDDLNVAFSYFDQDQHDSALPWFEKAIAAGDLIPDLLRIAHLDLGMIYAAKGQPEKAMAEYTAAIAAKPDDMLAYRRRISAHLDANHLEKALDDYETLRKFRPHDYDILMNIGWLNWQLGRYEPSATAFYYFANVDPYAWLWLQLTNVRRGKPVDDYKETGETRFWPGHLPRFYRGHLTEADMLKEAQDGSHKSGPCIGHLYAGLWHMVHQDSVGAAPLLKVATEKCGEGSTYWRLARSELDRATAGEKAK